MKSDHEPVPVDKMLLAALLTNHLKCLQIVRTLQLHSGVSKRDAKPSRNQLTNMDYVVSEALGRLASNDVDLDSALGQWETVFNDVAREVELLRIKNIERPIKLHVPDSIPDSSADLFRAIAKQGLGNTLSLSEDLGVDPSTVGRKVEPLRHLELIKRFKGEPLVGKRNWAYAYELTKRGRKAHQEMYGQTPRLYDYKPGTQGYRHHLGVNICVYSLIHFDPVGFYFGETADLVAIESNYGIKTELRADAVGWWGPRLEVGWWNPRYAYIEVESGANDFYLDITLKKYVLSKVETLMFVFLTGTFLKRFLKRVANTAVDGKHMTDEPLEIYATTLQNVVDGLEPELVTTIHRG